MINLMISVFIAYEIFLFWKLASSLSRLDGMIPLQGFSKVHLLMIGQNNEVNCSSKFKFAIFLLFRETSLHTDKNFHHPPYFPKVMTASC